MTAIADIRAREILDSRGNPTVEGLGMLIYQGQQAFESFFGVKPEVVGGVDPER